MAVRRNRNKPFSVKKNPFSGFFLRYIRVLLILLDGYDYLALAALADGACGNACDILAFGVDNAAFVCVHRLQSEAALIFEHLFGHTPCDSA